jgi:hypothetical protein
MSIEFVLTFILLAFAVVGVGELYLFAIREGQFLDFMARPLAWLHARSAQSKAAEFAFKSIGGCRVCTIQRFAELATLLLWFLFPEPWYYDLLTYVLFGGMVFYAQSRGQEQGVSWRNPQPEVESSKLDL